MVNGITSLYWSAFALSSQDEKEWWSDPGRKDELEFEKENSANANHLYWETSITGETGKKIIEFLSKNPPFQFQDMNVDSLKEVDKYFRRLRIIPIPETDRINTMEYVPLKEYNKQSDSFKFFGVMNDVFFNMFSFNPTKPGMRSFKSKKDVIVDTEFKEIGEITDFYTTRNAYRSATINSANNLADICKDSTFKEGPLAEVFMTGSLEQISKLLKIAGDYSKESDQCKDLQDHFDGLKLLRDNFKDMENIKYVLQILGSKEDIKFKVGETEELCSIAYISSVYLKLKREERIKFKKELIENTDLKPVSIYQAYDTAIENEIDYYSRLRVAQDLFPNECMNGYILAILVASEDSYDSELITAGNLKRTKLNRKNENDGSFELEKISNKKNPILIIPNIKNNINKNSRFSIEREELDLDSILNIIRSRFSKIPQHDDRIPDEYLLKSLKCDDE